MDANLPFPTTDASKWAAEFVRLHGGDEGLMLAWFANAIEHGRGPDKPLDHSKDEEKPRAALREQGPGETLRAAVAGLAASWEDEAAHRQSLEPTRAHEAANLLAEGILRAHAQSLRAALEAALDGVNRG